MFWYIAWYFHIFGIWSKNFYNCHIINTWMLIQNICMKWYSDNYDIDLRHMFFFYQINFIRVQFSHRSKSCKIIFSNSKKVATVAWYYLDLSNLFFNFEEQSWYVYLYINRHTWINQFEMNNFFEIILNESECISLTIESMYFITTWHSYFNHHKVESFVLSYKNNNRRWDKLSSF